MSEMTKENLLAAMDDVEAFFDSLRDLLDSGSTFDEVREEFNRLSTRAKALGIGGLPSEFIRQSRIANRIIV